MRAWEFLCLSLLTISPMHPGSAQQVFHPEDLAGRWEAPDGHGGEVGMNILISTTVAGSATGLVNVPQTVEDFTVGLYQRANADVEALGFNFSATSPDGGAVWDGQQLRIDLRQVADLPEVHVHLAWNDEAKVWTGSFERGAFQEQAITLQRPARGQKSVFAGTWFDSNDVMNTCVHIAQGQDGTFTAWGDDLLVPGRIRYGNGILPRERVLEHYGEIAKVKVTGADRIEVELRAYTAACCSHPFTATISSDANSLVGEWLDSPRPVKLTRVQGGSCLAAASQQ